MLLMSNALLPFFFFKREDRFAGMDCPKDGVGLGVDVGVNGEDTTVGKDKLLARFCSWAADGQIKINTTQLMITSLLVPK